MEKGRDDACEIDLYRRSAVALGTSLVCAKYITVAGHRDTEFMTPVAWLLVSLKCAAALSASNAVACPSPLTLGFNSSVFQKKKKITFFFFFLLFKLFFTTVFLNGISPVGNSGCLPLGKPAATKSRYPT